ncbi:hypothetical protein AB1Y20_015078 [Prymnesium parvum]|uniref:EF-hand domain-containing protein n=1 Tax=Prymnesium parvum TaxID=97485 RepID=A0AB34JVP4_PRYPA
MASLDEGVLLHLVAALRSANPQEQGSALTQLAQLVDISFGEEAERLCAQLRAHGAMEEIGRLLEAPEPYNHQMALLLVGNVASDAVDSQASLTRARLQRVDAFSKLLRYVFSSDWITLVYALGAVQNTCTELEYVEMMQRAGCVPRLQDLIRQGDEPIQQYAQGCLTNMRQTILTASPARRVSDQRYDDAARRVQRHARGRQARKKYGELRLLKDLNGGELPEQAKATAHQQLLRRLEEFKQSPRSRQQSQKSVVLVEEQRPALNLLEEETAARQRLEMANAAADAAQLAQAALEGKRHRDELMVGRSNSALHRASPPLPSWASHTTRAHDFVCVRRDSTSAPQNICPRLHESTHAEIAIPPAEAYWHTPRSLTDASGSSGSLPTAAVDDKMPSVGVRPTPFLQIARPRQVEDRIAISGAGAEATGLRVGDSEDLIAITDAAAKANGKVVMKCEDQTVHAEAGAEANVAVVEANEGQIAISTGAQVNEAVVGVSEDQITITLTGADTIGVVDGESEDQMVSTAAGSQADGAVGESENQLATTSVGVHANGAVARESEEQMVITDAGADANAAATGESDEQMVITDAGGEATVAVVGESEGQMVITDAGGEASVAVVEESEGQMVITTDANGAVVGQREEQMAINATGAGEDRAVVGEREEQMVIAARGAEADVVVVGASEEQISITSVGAEADGAVVGSGEQMAITAPADANVAVDGEMKEQMVITAAGAEANGAVVEESERKMVITDTGVTADVALVVEQVASEVPTPAPLQAEAATAAESVVSMAVEAALREAELEMELARTLDGAHPEGEAKGAEARAPEMRIASVPAGVSADRAPTATQLASVVPPPVTIAMQEAPAEAAVETGLAHGALEGREADIIYSYATASAEVVESEAVQQQAPDREWPKQSGHFEETVSASEHEDAADIARGFVRLIIGVAVEQLKASPQSLPIPFTRSAHEREQARCLDREREQREHAADLASSLVRQIIYSAVEETKDCSPRPPIPLTGGDVACAEDMRSEAPSATPVAAEVRDAPLHDALPAPTVAVHDPVVEATPIPSASEESLDMHAPHLEGESPALSCGADSLPPPPGGSADKATAESSAAESIQAAMRGKLSRMEAQSRREAAQADEGAVEDSATPCVAVLDAPDAKQERPSSVLGAGGTTRQPLELPTEQHPSSPNVEGAVEGTSGAQGSATKKGVRKARFSELTEGERLAAERQAWPDPPAARARQLEEIRSKQKEEERRALEREAAAAAAAAAEQEKRRLAALEAARQRRAQEDVCNAAVRFEVAGFERDRERRAMECIKRRTIPWLRCAVRRYRARKKRKELSEGKQKKKLELEAAQRKFEVTQRKQAAEASRKQRAKMQHDAEQHLKKMEADRAQAAVKLQSASRREQARKTFKLKKQSAITIERYHRGRLARRHCSSQMAERQSARRYELAALGIQASYRRSKSIVVAKQRRQRLLVLKSRRGSPPGRGSPADFFAANLQAVHRGKKARRRAEQLRAKEAAERAEWATLRYGLHQSISMKLSAESSQVVVDINGPEVVAVVSAAFETTSAMWRLAHSPRNKRRRPMVRGFDIEPEGTLFGMPPPHRPRSGRPPTPSVSAAPAGVSPLLKHLPASLHARASHVASEQMGHSFSLPLLASASPRSLSPQLGASSRADRSKPLSLESQLARTKSNLSLGNSDAAQSRLGSTLSFPQLPISDISEESPPHCSCSNAALDDVPLDWMPIALEQGSSLGKSHIATEELRRRLAGHMRKVLEAFEYWAANRDKQISRDEFRRTLKTSARDLDLRCSKADIDSLFDSLDVSGTGTIEFVDLKRMMLQEQQLTRSLRERGVTKYALRNGLQHSTSAPSKRHLQLGTHPALAEELRLSLTANAARAVDLFKKWDADGDGAITRSEFHRAIPMLGIVAPPREIDRIFDEFDLDGSGDISSAELHHALRVGATVQLPPKLQAGGAGEIVLKAKTQQPLRSKPKPIRELDELLKMLPGGARHADLPVELPAVARNSLSNLVATKKTQRAWADDKRVQPGAKFFPIRQLRTFVEVDSDD